MIDDTFLDRVLQKYSDLISKVFGRHEIPCNDIGKSFIKEFFCLEGIGWSHGSYKYARSLVSERPSKCVLRSPVINALQVL